MSNMQKCVCFVCEHFVSPLSCELVARNADINALSNFGLTRNGEIELAQVDG